jgi:hypothetical protein
VQSDTLATLSQHGSTIFARGALETRIGSAELDLDETLNRIERGRYSDERTQGATPYNPFSFYTYAIHDSIPLVHSINSLLAFS